MQKKDDKERIETSTLAFGRPEQAKNYSLYRPDYPEFFFSEHVRQKVEELRTRLPKNQPLVALDLGCGSGQATKQIARHFDEVFGIDINQKQMDFALKNIPEDLKNKKIEFISGDCSYLSKIHAKSLKNCGVHAIFMCQAFHWFNQGDILEQCKAILKPNDGYLFLLGYSKFVILPSSRELKPAFEEFYASVHEYFDFDRNVLNRFYKDIDFGKIFSHVEYIEFSREELNFPVKNFLCYLDTFSAYRNKLERVDKSKEEDSMRILACRLGFKGYEEGGLQNVDFSHGPQVLNFATPFFMYILR